LIGERKWSGLSPATSFPFLILDDPLDKALERFKIVLDDFPKDVGINAMVGVPQ
jgi:hypothetical protein